MTLTTSGAKNLVKKLRSQFGLSCKKANDAVDANWMSLACSDVADWRKVELSLDTFPSCGVNCVRVIDGDRLIATMTFPEGTLPQTELQQAWTEYDAYVAANPIWVETPNATIPDFFTTERAAITADLERRLADVGGDEVVIHVLPQIFHDQHTPSPKSYRVSREDIVIEDALITIPGEQGERIIILSDIDDVRFVPAQALDGDDLTAARVTFEKGVGKLLARSEQHDNTGIIVTYDPMMLAPPIIGPAEIQMTDACVSDGSRPNAPVIFALSDVAHVETHLHTVNVFTTDGNLVAMHADIDWYNVLG